MSGIMHTLLVGVPTSGGGAGMSCTFVFAPAHPYVAPTGGITYTLKSANACENLTTVGGLSYPTGTSLACTLVAVGNEINTNLCRIELALWDAMTMTYSYTTVGEISPTAWCNSTVGSFANTTATSAVLNEGDTYKVRVTAINFTAGSGMMPPIYTLGTAVETAEFQASICIME